MKKLLLLGLLLWPTLALAQGPASIGPPNAILCNQGAQLSGKTATSTYSLVPAVTGQRIYICGWHVTTTASVAIFQITAGTQGVAPNCGGATTLTPSLMVNLAAPSTDHIDYATIQSGISQQVCLAITNSSSISAILWYSQF